MHEAVIYNKRNRIQYIDIARGMAMLCVIIGHMGYESLNIFIFSFHMPLFFLLSGYFQRPEDSMAFIKKKARALLVPYIFTCICVILATQFNNWAKIILNRKDALSVGTLLLEWVKAALLGSGGRKDFLWLQSDFAIGNIWFLLALFFAQILVNCFFDRRWGLVCIAIIAAAGIISSKYFWMPFSVQAGAVASIYVATGCIYRKGGVHWLIS